MKIATNYTRSDTKKVAYLEHDLVKVGGVDDLLKCFRPNDLIVVNDSATAPMSFVATDQGGRHLEVRLLKAESGGSSFRAIIYEEGSWKVPTESRKIVRPDSCGGSIFIGSLEFLVERSDNFVCQLQVRSEEYSTLKDLYRCGTMIQYSYMEKETPVWAAQSIFASRAWSSEAPSAAFAFSWKLIFSLVNNGVQFASVTHAAGFSSIGDFNQDRILPLTEMSDVSQKTLQSIVETRKRGGRVIAVGTSVVRAVEASRLRMNFDSPYENSLRIYPEHEIVLFDGILTGLQQEGESHFDLLNAFLPAHKIEEILQEADRFNCLTHEFGDFMLLMKPL